MEELELEKTVDLPQGSHGKVPELPLWTFSAQGQRLGSQQTLGDLAHLFPSFLLALYPKSCTNRTRKQ